MVETLSPTARRGITAFTLLAMEHWNGREAPIQDLAKFVQDIVGRVTITGCNVAAGTKFLRARVIPENATLFVRDVIARLPNESPYFQRCNFPGQSMLYCGVNLDTCFTEIDPKLSDSIAVSQFEVIETQAIKVAQIGGLEHYRRHERAMLDVPELSVSTKGALDSTLNRNNLDELVIDAFMAQILSRKVNCEADYRLSALIANLIMTKTNADGVMYPSVEHRGGLCYAIKSEVAFSKLRLVAVEERRVVEKLPYNIWGAPIVRRCSSWENDGRLLWDK